MFLAVLRYTDDLSLAVLNASLVALLILGLVRSLARGRVAYASLAAFTVMYIFLYPAVGPDIALYASPLPRAEIGLDPETYQQYVSFVDELGTRGWRSSVGIPLPGNPPQGELGAAAGLVAAVVAGSVARGRGRKHEYRDASASDPATS